MYFCKQEAKAKKKAAKVLQKVNADVVVTESKMNKAVPGIQDLQVKKPQLTEVKLSKMNVRKSAAVDSMVTSDV